MKLIKPLLIAGGVSVALVILVEVIIRIAFPVPMEPPGRLVLTNDIPGVKQSVDFRFNSERLRTVGWTEKKQGEGIRLLCLGGNGTIAPLQNSQDAWWGQIVPMLSAELGEPVESACPVTVPEGKILPGVAVAERALLHYEVDLIVVMFGFNDAIATPGDFKLDPERLARLRAQEPVGKRYQLAKASHILRIVRNARTTKAQRRHQDRIARPNYKRDWLAARAQHIPSPPMADTIDPTGDDPQDEFQ